MRCGRMRSAHLLRTRGNREDDMGRWLLIGTLCVGVAGCELVGDVFQAGFAVGLIVVAAVLAVVLWIARRFRG